MRHAYSRLKKADPQAARTWDDAVWELQKGDHYLLVLFGNVRSDLVPTQRLFGWSFWNLLGISILILAVGLIVFVSMLHRADSLPH
jgi:hypothetical protein